MKHLEHHVAQSVKSLQKWPHRFHKHISGRDNWELVGIHADGCVNIGLNRVKPCGTRDCAGLDLFYFQMKWGNVTNAYNHCALPQASGAIDEISYSGLFSPLSNIKGPTPRCQRGWLDGYFPQHTY